MKKKKNKKENVKLLKIISFRVTKLEYDKIQNILLKFNLNKSDAMRKLVNETIK